MIKSAFKGQKMSKLSKLSKTGITGLWATRDKGSSAPSCSPTIILTLVDQAIVLVPQLGSQNESSATWKCT